MSFEPKTIIEPFRVKVVEPMPMTRREERIARLNEARFNLFSLRAEHVTIDLMTDSGTGAMSQDQWAALMRGDESYAGARSFFEFEAVLKELTGMRHIVPTHQGRAAERILFSVIGGEGKTVLSNTHFDTTRANVEASGARALDLVIDEGLDPHSEHPFKGNVNLGKVEAFLKEHPGQVPAFVLTITNNGGGGQPVSLANARALKELLAKHNVPLFLDCARFAENAWLVRMREAGQGERTAKAIAQDFFSLADGALMSAKKDGLANIGGFLAMNDSVVAEQCRNALILTEGFPTYGGLAGRDLGAVAVGLQEVLDHRYLEYRIATVEYLHRRLKDAGIPLLQPAGGHAVYLDAPAFLPHIPREELPGQALSVALYREAGVRSVEIGTVMFGHTREDGKQEPATLDLVRLALPRRVYTQSHVDYLAEAVIYVFENRDELKGFRIAEEPTALRHFTCAFEELN